MNKLLHVARKKKELTEAQIAKVLQIEENKYRELEHSIADVTSKQASQLTKLYEIDAEQFIYNERGRKDCLNMQWTKYRGISKTYRQVTISILLVWVIQP